MEWYYKTHHPSYATLPDFKKELLDTLKQPAPPKLSSRIPGYPLKADRNIYQNEISYILDFVWQTLSQEEGTPVFVENCYVNPHAHEDILSLVYIVSTLVYVLFYILTVF